MMRQWFTPTVAAGLFFLMLLLPQGVIGARMTQTITSTSFSQEQRRVTEWGIPTLVEESYVALPLRTPVTKLGIRYANVLIVLLGAAVIALPLGRLATGPRGVPRMPGREHPARTLLMAIVATAAVAFLIAISISKWYWGYWISPPPLDERVTSAASVVSHAAFDTVREKDGALRKILAPSLFIPNDNRVSVKVPHGPGFHHSRGERETALFDQRGLLRGGGPAEFPLERLDKIRPMLDRTGLVVKGASGYPDAELLHGRIWELWGANHQPLLFVSAQGREVSNDHYPYYEFLFDNSSPDAPVLLSHNRFYFDVAGMEGMTAWAMFRGVGMLLLGPVMVVCVLVMALRRWPMKFRDKRGFPVELATPAGPIIPVQKTMNSPEQTNARRCMLCDKPIAPARLEALPGVTTCIDCARKHPRKINTSGIDLSQASPINRNGFAPKE